MSHCNITRRGFVVGLATLITAPAIVRASSIMPVRRICWDNDPVIRLSDYTFDGFNYVSAAGDKFCVNPVGRLSVSVRNGVVVEQVYKPGADFYLFSRGEKLSGDLLGGVKIGGERIGRLSDDDYKAWSDDLHARVKRFRG